MKVPILYREYISPHILVMEYIDGFAVNDKADLLANGYDLNEIGTKYVDNFIKQVMEDGFSMRIHIRETCGSRMERSSGSIWG